MTGWTGGQVKVLQIVDKSVRDQILGMKRNWTKTIVYRSDFKKYLLLSKILFQEVVQLIF